MTAGTEPLWAVTPDKVAEAVRRIVAVARPTRVIVFGSQARGDPGRDSDLDLVVIEKEVADRYAEMVRLHRALSGLILPVDILVVSESDFEEWAATPGSIYRTIQRERKVLFEAACEIAGSGGA
jgi:predicted nucleotidyltransferase